MDWDKPIFNTRDLADILGVSTNYIRQQVRDAKLRATVHIQRGPRILLRFSLNDVLDYDRDAARRLEQTNAA